MVFNPFATHQWKLAHERKLALGPKAIVMGILNVTPDSFSDGGRYDNLDVAVVAAELMIEAGASIIDIGGESTRPGAAPIDAATEKQRVLPVIRALKQKSGAILSIDTYRAETARAAIGEGAHIVNDVWGLQKDRKMARTVADTGAGIIIMHTGRGRQVLDDVIEDQKIFLNRSLAIAADAGIDNNAIVLDPGIGFAKGMAENIALLNRFEELQQFGFPLLVGTSRKRFLGTITGKEDATARDSATAATSVVARMKGACLFRVHDVAINRDSLQVADALLNENG